MSDENGLKMTDVDGRPVKIIYECHSGVIFHITPINLPTLRAIQLMAESKFPYPDPRPYQVLDENAFVEGQLSKAEDNPEYIEACQLIDSQRKRWSDRAVFDYATELPKYPTKEKLVAGFADRLKALRQIAVVDTDDYEAILFHLVLTWNQVAQDTQKRVVVAGNEYGRIIELAVQTVALTPDEVQAGIRFFRPYVPKRPFGKVAR